MDEFWEPTGDVIDLLEFAGDAFGDIPGPPLFGEVDGWPFLGLGLGFASTMNDISAVIRFCCSAINS